MESISELFLFHKSQKNISFISYEITVTVDRNKLYIHAEGAEKMQDIYYNKFYLALLKKH